jgi:hypothetical protein
MLWPEAGSFIPLLWLLYGDRRNVRGRPYIGILALVISASRGEKQSFRINDFLWEQRQQREQP